METKSKQRKRAQEIIQTWQRHNPVPETELSYHNHYTLLVAVILSAQARDVQVNKCTDQVFSTVSTPCDMLALGLESFQKHISSIGLYKQKAKNVLLMSAQLIERFNGQVPDTLEDLESLPGVGRKTANVVLNVAFDKPTIPVDTHVFRVAKRLQLSFAGTPLGVEKDLDAIWSGPEKKNAHHWLILHGRYTCKAQAPDCQNCLIKQLCPSALEG